MNPNFPNINNVYIPQQNDSDFKRNIVYTEEFKQFYEAELLKKQQSQVKQESDIQNRQESINNYIQKYSNKINSENESTIKIRKKTTSISIDTRDPRINRILYPKPNSFKVFFGKTFVNVSKIELKKVEIPNTSAVINSSNNKLYWINQEDIDIDTIDPITLTYPIYTVSLRIGSYNLSTLQTELQSKMSLIKRRNGTGDFHSFNVSLDNDTDKVKFISVTLQYLENNPFSSVLGSGIITVSAIGHGFISGDTVFISGASTFAGISSSILNSEHILTRINNDQFTIEINIKASDTVEGGGNLIKLGTQAPFQFLFGEYTDSISPIIGFPNENSSQRIDTEISSIKNINIIEIETVNPHNFENNYDFLGQFLEINTSGTIPNIDYSLGFYNDIVYLTKTNGIGLVVYNFNISIPDFTFTLPSQLGASLSEIILPISASSVDNFYKNNFIKITSGVNNSEIRKITSYNASSNTLIIQGSFVLNSSNGDTVAIFSEPEQVSLISGSERIDGVFEPFFLFNNVNYPIIRISNYISNFVKIKTENSHMYSPSDSGITTTFYNTNSVPSFDGEQTIISIPSNDSFLIRGAVLTGGEGSAGSFPKNNPIKSFTFNISNATSGITTTFETTIAHNLQIGDQIKVYNVKSIPTISNTILQILSIPDSTHFIVNFSTSSIDINTDPKLGEISYFGFGLLQVSFDNHSFNQIVSLINGDPGEVIIQTKIPHNFTDNQFIRINQTNSNPSINNFYKIRIISADTFSIAFYTPEPTSGVLASQIGANANQIYLPTSVGASNYSGYFIKLTSGVADNDFKFINSYSSFVATLDSNWAIQPQIGDLFILYEVDIAFSSILTNQSLAAANEVIMPSLSTSNENLITSGDYIKITSGANTGIIKKIISYNSSSNIAVLDSNWLSNPISGDSFLLYNAPLITGGTNGTIGMNNDFYIYGTNDIGGISNQLINGINSTSIEQRNLHSVRDIIDENTFTFMISNAFSTSEEQGGGNNIFINSLLHGFSGTQDNSKNNLLNRSINLEGENYIFLCSPQLDTMLNTGNVENIFARITLDAPPGFVVFSSVNNTISSAKEYYEKPLVKLEELDFSVRNYNNTLYDFNDLDWSMVLDITEDVFTDNLNNYSSRTGIIN